MRYDWNLALSRLKQPLTMTKIIFTVAGWLIRKSGLLLLLILALLLTPSVKDAWRIVEDFQSETVISDVVNQTKGIASDKNSSAQELKDWLTKLRISLDRKKTERARLDQNSCILPTCELSNYARIYRADAEIETYAQVLIYGEAVVRGAQTCKEYQQNQPIVNQLLQTVQGLRWWDLLLPAYRPLINRLNQQEARQSALFNSCQRYRMGASTFQVDQSTIKKTLDLRHALFLTKLNEFKKLKEQTLGQVLAVLPSALWLLLGIILTPIGFKTFAYYAIAPLATRKFGIRLQPSASGELKVLCPNDYLQRITLKEGEEFLFARRY